MKKGSTFIALAAAIVWANPTPAFAAPAAVTNVVVTSKSLANTLPTASVVEVSWNRTNTAISYAVAATATGQTARTGSQPNCSTETCTSTVGNLTGGVSYNFVVTSIAADGSQTSTAPASETPTSVPEAPTSLIAVTADGAVTLNWAAPANTGGLALGSYTITDGGAISQTATGDKTSASITGLTAGSNYTFTIKASNGLGASETVSYAPITAVSKPAAPAMPTAQVSGSTLSVSWAAPSANGSPITGYKVYLINNQGADVGAATDSVSTSASIPNVAAGTYTVKVLAVNSLGEGPRSPASSSVSINAGSLANALVFTPNTLLNMDVGATQNVSASAPSGGTVTLTVSSSPSGACTYAGGVITAVSPGSCTVTGATPATSGYAAGTGTKTFTIKSPQSITFGAIASQTLPGTLAVSASATSGLTVTFAASGACSISSRTVTFLNAGQCTITASQAGTANYSAATSVIRAFNIAAAPILGGSGGVGGGSGGSIGGGGGVVTNPSPVTPAKPRPPVVIIPSQPAPKPSTYFATTSSTAGAASARIVGSVSTVSVKVGKPVYASISGIKVGTSVQTKIKTADGKMFVLSTKKIGSTGRFTSSVIKPTKTGTYSIIVSYGKVTKVLKVSVKK